MSPFKPIIQSVIVPSKLSREVRRSTHGSLRWSQYNDRGVLTETGVEQEQDSEMKIWKTHALRSGDLGFKVGECVHHYVIMWHFPSLSFGLLMHL